MKLSILFNKICIVGVGLIGGSIGLAVKEKKIAKWVIGVSRHKSTLKKALRKKAIDVGLLDLAEGVRGADLVILCAPVSVIVKQMALIAPHLKKGARVMDVGSSKVLIENEAKKRFKNNFFFGCHPMAGSEHSGVEHASADLFQKSVCFLTKSDPIANRFWKALGAIPVVMDAQKHDAWVAKASHLPHLLAFSLFQDFTLPKFPLNPSLRGLARLAGSNPKLWADIFISNRQALLKAINDFETKGLKPFKKLIGSMNTAHVESFITASNKNTVS